MRFTHLLPLAALSAAIVLPDEQVFADLAVPKRQPSESRHKESKSILDKLPCPHHLFDGPKSWIESFRKPRNPIDHALDHSESFDEESQENFVRGFDADAWLEDAIISGFLEGEGLDSPFAVGPQHDGPPPLSHGPPPFGPSPSEGPPNEGPPGDGPPGRGPPGHGPPGHGPPGHGPPGHKPPHKKPHKPHPPHHHHKPNKTIFELISESKYTTKLAKLIANDSELVEVLNSTKANYTLFAPTDSAFAKIPEHAPKPSKEFIRKALLYHIAPGLYPAGRLIFSHTVPTLYNETLLGDNPQRLVAKGGLRGISLNFYSKLLAANIPATNGIIHGVGSIIVPPPRALKIVELLPAQFSTLLLALEKTGLVEELAEAKSVGGTFFVPPNDAFKKLGPRINAFLFSKFGQKYLKALLKYHIVANETLYSNAFYGPSKADLRIESEQEAGADAAPYLHYDLPTLLGGKSLAIDVTRFGPFITFKINGFVRVVVSDGVAKDGVLQVVNKVLIPPKTSPGGAELEYWQGEEMSVDEFKERLGPFVDGDMHVDL
ncbi:uncharacterized protein PV09_07704 [Verruconis gallopava]|uniref:FAS1 domain-containing protein n=1 Tax=Verruconis gallopava TaxID=253628 RepID=A0A0D2ANJ9_9PEZI|nr:uncharacterized protein PV09_07704 [Verruconis gallopava]KIW00719.1 hypothetical protein PV09_07704 [Verruconis gallopava]